MIRNATPLGSNPKMKCYTINVQSLQDWKTHDGGCYGIADRNCDDLGTIQVKKIGHPFGAAYLS
jgi:hypothetical protein